MHKFYAKNMATTYTILARSAHSKRGRRSTLIQEMVRRLLNTNKYVPKEEMNDIIS